MQADASFGAARTSGREGSYDAVMHARVLDNASGLYVGSPGALVTPERKKTHDADEATRTYKLCSTARLS